MVTSFGCRSDGSGTPQSPNRWRSCKVRGKMGEGVMEEGAMERDSGMVIDVEGVWILDGMGMLSCIGAGIGVSVCVLVLVVVVALVVLLVRGANGVVSGSSGGGAGGGGGDSEGGGGVGGIWLCFLSVLWVEWWGFCGGGGVGGLWIGVVGVV